jgi:signal transduction histidine kinase
LAEREGIGVQFHGGGLPDRPPPDIALCVYRVAQEALRNAVRHGKCERVELTLHADPEFLYLEVRDLGCGFSVEDTRGKPGLGLISMKERAHLVGGEISISSLPGQGTSIALRAPLPEETS